MNKSRRMAALQARALAKAGWDVLLMDLYGCGDSSGDAAEATWNVWLDDVDAAWQWLTARGGDVWLWGLRVGALIAANTAARSERACRLLLWQPVESGHLFVQQFLRSRVMSDAMANGRDRTTTAGLLETLAAGESIEVAGYALSPQLMLPLDRLEMPMLPRGSTARWVEISDFQSSQPGPALRPTLTAWRAAGIDATSVTVTCPQFWQTQEICECESLIRTGVSLLSR
jgi:exosortase A-associated hydrolase 2